MISSMLPDRNRKSPKGQDFQEFIVPKVTIYTYHFILIHIIFSLSILTLWYMGDSTDP